MNILDIPHKTVAIVVFSRERRNAEQAKALGTMSPRLVHYQVTIDPDQITPSKKYIRFGAPADEIVGWQPVDAIEILEILAEEKNGELITLAKAA